MPDVYELNISNIPITVSAKNGFQVLQKFSLETTLSQSRKHRATLCPISQ